VVVAVIGLLAGVTVPAIRGMVQGKTVASGHRQLSDDLNRARQEALRLRTTVYVVFAPTNVWVARPELDSQVEAMIVGRQLAPQGFREQALRSFTNIALGVYHSYALLVERETGAQPGRSHTRYLGPGWQTLPDGVIPWARPTGATSPCTSSRSARSGFPWPSSRATRCRRSPCISWPSGPTAASPSTR
jgi:hypothetical protein